RSDRGPARTGPARPGPPRTRSVPGLRARCGAQLEVPTVWSTACSESTLAATLAIVSLRSFAFDRTRHEDPSPPADGGDLSRGRPPCAERPGAAEDRRGDRRPGRAQLQLGGGQRLEVHALAPLQGAPRGRSNPHEGERN